MSVDHADSSPSRRNILPVLVLSVFGGASVWFAGNAVLADLAQDWQLPADALARVTSSVQLGFIAGTLLFAFFAIPDRFSPSRVYLICSIAAALSTLVIVLIPASYLLLLVSRFVTGFFLAGIYPVGMKIASGWYRADLGNAIGLIVAGLILGTAFPHLINSISSEAPWQLVIVSVSIAALAGGFAVNQWVPDGPWLRKGTKFDPAAIKIIFSSAPFRASAFGYFGHMWELYAFWAFLPVFLAAHGELAGLENFDVSFWSFLIIGVGVFGSAIGGLLSKSFGSAPVAAIELSISGVCCLLSPLLFFAPTPVFLVFLLIWGLTVAGDSPQFSALNAATAPPQYVGSALTLANCIGFVITIVSIELLSGLVETLPISMLFFVLTLGPAFGLWCFRPLLSKSARSTT